MSRSVSGHLEIPLLTAFLGFVFLLALGVGELPLGASRIWAGLLGHDGLARQVLLDLRLPRALVGVAVGSALAASGVVMQAFFRNPLASPGLLGVSSGASLGAVVAIALGWSASNLLVLPAAAALGAFAATAAVLALAKSGTEPERMLLSGVALNALLGACTSFILLRNASLSERSAQILFWLMGGLEDRGWAHVWMGLPGIALGCLALLPLGRAMNLLSLGESGAQSLGVNVRRLRIQLILLSTMLAALATAVAGIVGFVGLVAPHALRLIWGPDHRRLLPAAMLAGASFVLMADLACRLGGGGLRLGVVTAIIGGPFFLWLLRRRP